MMIIGSPMPYISSDSIVGLEPTTAGESAMHHNHHHDGPFDAINNFINFNISGRLFVVPTVALKYRNVGFLSEFAHKTHTERLK